jgi:cell division protease FtsH
MDGFDTHSGVILIGSTNRPDVLDPALLRPGRFDRQIVIERPDIKGREEILKVHVQGVKMAKECDLGKVARQTSGFSGADLANLVNEAALLAARRKKEAVTQIELEESIERVMVGPERKSRVISKKEKEIKAVHESGHALVALLLPCVDPVRKISIIPRGYGIGGFTLQMPLEDRHLVSEKELKERMAVLLGGRVAESLYFGEVTSGAQDDLAKATHIAQAMVCELGMSPKLGHLTFGKKDREVFLGRDLLREKDYSEQTAVMIDEEVRRYVDEAYARGRSIVEKNRDKLDVLAKRLLEKEVLEEDEIRRLVGLEPRPAEPDETPAPPAAPPAQPETPAPGEA